MEVVVLDGGMRCDNIISHEVELNLMVCALDGIVLLERPFQGFAIVGKHELLLCCGKWQGA